MSLGWLQGWKFRMRTVGLLSLLAGGALLGLWSLPAVAQAPQPHTEEDPAMARILLWQLDRGETAKAERLLRANLPQVEKRLEEMIQEIDRERDIAGRFGAVSIWFGPGWGELAAKTQHYEKLFDFYRRISGNENLYKRFEVRKLRVEGAHYTNQGETTCGTNLDWEGAQKLYRQAIDSLEKAFLIVREQKDFRMMASIKDNIGSTQIRLLHPQEALRAYMEGLPYADQLDGDLYKGLLRLNLANVYVWIGEPERALPYAQEAINIFRKIGRGTWEANAMMTLGNAYLRQQKFSSAWETLHLTLQKAQQSGEYRVYGRTLMNLGAAGLQLKKQESQSLLEQGVAWYKEDNEIYPAIEREAVLQDGLRLLSQLSQQAGKQSQGEQYIKEYLEMLGSDPNRYQTLRQSPCFAIYMARPVAEKLSSR
ncbi:MAG: tetratricopeptide repeat protein [Acidobacteria bacterium]|nr:tetratricopeptide repeat protein [Acidobacteriota bacterium]